MEPSRGTECFRNNFSDMETCTQAERSRRDISITIGCIRDEDVHQSPNVSEFFHMIGFIDQLLHNYREKPMTPFESLLWNIWLPRVRTVINNDWSPSFPHPAVRLYEAWSTFLPPFIRDNILDQLILPKVQKAVNDWNSRKDVDVTLHSLIFPWLPHLGLRLEGVLGDAKRKVKSLLRAWNADEGVPKDLIIWKDVSACLRLCVSIHPFMPFFIGL